VEKRGGIEREGGNELVLKAVLTKLNKVAGKTDRRHVARKNS